MSRQTAPIVPPTPPPPPVEKPKAELREAIDLRRGGKGWQIVVLTYGDGACVETVALDTDSAPDAAARFILASRRKATLAATGVLPPGGESVL